MSYPIKIEGKENLVILNKEGEQTYLDLHTLSNGSYMFREHRKLLSFNSDLPNLTDGSYMFNNCVSLVTFNSDLPKLTNGLEMFSACYDLETFNSSLPVLTDGGGMFENCKLPASEINKILTSLPSVTGDHTITFTNCPGAKTCDTSIGTSKGWTVHV